MRMTPAGKSFVCRDQQPAVLLSFVPEFRVTETFFRCAAYIGDVVTHLTQMGHANYGNILIHQYLHAFASPMGVTCSSANEAA